MDLIFLYKGLILGFSVAAPVGPIGILCINRTLNKSMLSGFVSGLGAATADLLYGIIAGLGLTVISDFLINQKLIIQLVGLAFLFYLAVKTLTKKKSEMEFKKTDESGLLKDYLTTLFLTVTNPVTILFFLAVFAGLGLSSYGQSKFSSLLLVSGVFIGSGIWWLFLSGLAHVLKNRISKKILSRIDLISGLIILAFAIVLLVEIVKNI